jgi:hypothetical protein
MIGHPRPTRDRRLPAIESSDGCFDGEPKLPMHEAAWTTRAENVPLSPNMLANGNATYGPLGRAGAAACFHRWLRR